MSLVRQLGFRPGNTDRQLRDLGRVAKRNSLIWACITLVLPLGLVAFGVHLASSEGPGNFPLFVFMFALFALMLPYGAFKKHARLKRKLTFIWDLSRYLQDEWHPALKINLSIDLRAYDHEDKLIFKGKAPGGKTKTKFNDKWLSLSGTLADGTAVRIRREIALKHKAGSQQSEKRRLFFTIKPNPKRYDLLRLAQDQDSLRKRMKDSLHTLFDDPPEKFHVNLGSDASEFRIKVRQDDAPITAEEVFALLRAVISFLAARRSHHA